MSFSLHRGSAPLLVSIPHMGTRSRTTCARLRAARPGGRGHRLAPRSPLRLRGRAGRQRAAAPLSRYVMDLNRPPDDTPMYPGASNTELCPTASSPATAVPPGLRPSPQEQARRRASLMGALPPGAARRDRAHQGEHGFVLLWDAHSIRAEIPWLFEGRCPTSTSGHRRRPARAPPSRRRVAAAAARHPRRDARGRTAASRAATSRATTATGPARACRAA